MSRSVGFESNVGGSVKLAISSLVTAVAEYCYRGLYLQFNVAGMPSDISS